MSEEETGRTGRESLPARAMRRDHPSEEPLKSYHTTLEQQITRAEEELHRPASALLLSGLSAGLDIGFGPFLVAGVETLAEGTFSHATTRFLAANAYSVGFILVVLGRSALFTEFTMSAIQPVMDRRSTVAELLRLWGLILAANLVGAVLFALFGNTIGIELGFLEPHVIAAMANRVVEADWWPMLLSAVAAGWLMGMLVWLVTGARDTTSQIISVWLTTFIIGIAGLHHSIAGSIEVLMGLFVAGGPAITDFLRFLLWSVLGNVIGGVVFVALLKYAHIRGRGGDGAQPRPASGADTR